DGDEGEKKADHGDEITFLTVRNRRAE
ncbi:MAG: hypothetical protein RL015_3874, partial [Verrucomicrobiota bacterium]